MAILRFEFSDPRRVVVGTIGQPGERVFYLQAEQDSRITAVKLEKQQVAILAEQMAELLQGQGIELPPMVDIDTKPLTMPLESEFVVESMSIKFRQGDDFIQIEAAGEPEDSDDAGIFVVNIRLASAGAFIERCRRVVAAGRKPCPLCEQPLEVGGHICPRANGYLRHAFD